MADFRQTSASRGGDGYELDWNGFEVLAAATAAAEKAVGEVVAEAANMARTDHIWDNQTGQTEAAIFSEDARVEPGPHVFAEWGVEDRPRYNPDSGKEENVSTKDVAMFLEFGTVKMAPRPFLYPAWDTAKLTLWPLMRLYYADFIRTGRLRGPGGRFTGGF